MYKLLIGIPMLFLFGCLGMPDNVKPVKNFDIEEYLGTWYEIARLDHSFERGLDNVTATYEKKADGGIKVTNRGYSKKKEKWSEASGKAYFVDKSDEGYLKVSFFGPFYGSYVVFELDENYEYAYVTSSKKSYLWLLARTPDVDQEVIDNFVKKAKDLGYKTDELIFVEHDKVAE